MPNRGFIDAWLTEHHFVDDGYSPSLLPIAAAVAARTSRIRIGTFLILLPLHNPIRIAEDTATVDLISGGRFDLGVGLGYRRKEFADQGISHTERGARLREGVIMLNHRRRADHLKMKAGRRPLTSRLRAMAGHSRRAATALRCDRFASQGPNAPPP